MKIRSKFLIFLACFCSCTLSLAQLSPGKLASSHDHLEGLRNCTKCHDIGNKVPDNKCLNCHEIIDGLIQEDRGYHASYEVSSKTCIDCHSDHHGRSFEMTRFDAEQFDHDLTGYRLEGEHEIVDCRACHNPVNIKDPELHLRESTYLGLESDCLSCHLDTHQQTLGTDCLSCHNFDGFNPAPGFNHDQTNFGLVGGHNEISCIECHPRSVKNGNEFQLFQVENFNDCIQCHQDPHRGNLLPSCNTCHSEQSFALFRGDQYFNHNTTGFPLEGSHENQDCFSCHKREQPLSSLFQEFPNASANDCRMCHDDIHNGKFGHECLQCHNVNSFSSIKSTELIDHSLTDFPLIGQHNEVDCKSCHIEGYLDPLSFSNCFDCHEDYHQGEFTRKDISIDCDNCHSLDVGFDFSLFSIEEHQDTEFQLNGSHLATPCFACHLNEEQWTFRDIGNACADCHENIHEGFIRSDYYPNNQCESCHNSVEWASIDFDHALTNWSLEGKHQSLECRVCHYKMNLESGNLVQIFEGLGKDCYQCHEDVHDGQFAVAGITDCSTCHDTKNWNPGLFDHNNTDFPLTGKHIEVSCIECHLSYQIDVSQNVTFQIERFECIDCHF